VRPCKIRVAVAGPNGRMGRTIVQAIHESESFVLAAAFGRHPGVLQPAFGTAAEIQITNDPAAALRPADVLIDFTTPDTSVGLAALTAAAHLPHVIGTTGFSPVQDQQIAGAATATPIVKSSNTSMGVAVLVALVRRASASLQDFDIGIFEMHHRMKADAPSGTALLLGSAAAEGRSDSVSKATPKTERSKVGDDIDYASLRGGTVVGEHSVIFSGLSERVILSHSAEDRIVFARGALAAARWLQGKAPGLYGMSDVLGLS
jgi:4-hydroxy-tetrahydrodipicolinate reductase